MKKTFALVALLALAACGKKAEPAPAVDTTATMAPAPAPAMDSTMQHTDSVARDTAAKVQ
jgi:hypothetical protein